MSGQHTQGRIGVVEARTEGYCLCVDGRLGAEVVVSSEDEYGHYGPISNEANARRLAACWNACQQATTEDLEIHGELWTTSFVMNGNLAKELAAACARIESLEAAIDKLAACKGRYHTEANFNELLAVREGK